MDQGLLYGKNSFVAEVTFKAIHFEISFFSPRESFSWGYEQCLLSIS